MAVGTKILHGIERIPQWNHIGSTVYNIGEKPTVTLYTYHVGTPKHTMCCVCVFSSHSFWTSSSLDVPAGVTQEKGHTGFLIHLLSAVRASNFFARRIQSFLSLVDCEVGIFCTNDFVLQPLGIFSSKPSVPMKLCWSAGIFRLQFSVLTALLFKEKFEHI